MTNFVKAETVKTKLEKIDSDKVEKFINKFNAVIKKGDEENGDGSFSLNNGLDKIPTLNSNEFDYAVGLALQQGWILTQFDDNYQTTSYKMQKRNS